MTPGTVFMVGCTMAAMVIGAWVARPGGPDPRNPRQAAEAREEYALALAGILLLSVLASTVAAWEMAR